MLNFMSENELSYKIRGAIFTVYNELGPGLLESTYQSALEYELNELGLTVEKEVALPLKYKNISLAAGYRIDLIVEKKVLIELKSVEEISAVHHKQVITYLKLSGIKLGILVNFNTMEISKSIFRKVNNLAE
jgi:GxxExxY protein